MKKSSYYSTILLLLAIFIVVAAISERYFFRADLTEGGQYSLSKATKNILKNLDQPVTVSAYFTKDLAPDLAKVKRNFQDMLMEYSSLSGGKVVYKFENPNENEETENEALSAGIRPVLFNAREKDEITQQKVFMGAVIRLGNEKEVLPFIDPNSSIEYSLSTSIKKLSVTDKPKIGFVQGQGEPSKNEYQQVMSELEVLYNVEDVYLTDTMDYIRNYQALVIAAPKDTFNVPQLQILDHYLGKGGRLFIALNHVQGDLQTLRGSVQKNGLSDWLAAKGLQIDDSFVTDANCGTVGVSQRTNFGTMTSQVKFPFIPIITQFEDHAATKGLEQLVMAFCSPMNYVGDTTAIFTPLAMTSENSGVQNTPVMFDINKKWTQSDFTAGSQVVAGVLEGANNNGLSKIALVTNGDFAYNGTGQRPRMQQEDNISFMVNIIDWLSDDTGLIELRTKTITSRPIDVMTDGTKLILKWLNFLLPLILVIIYGLIRMQINRNKRIKRMQEGYVK
ncbi:MAG: Gldg family protein [Bacteroidetes bacterium]|nr:Gldg family protein [Bacteroidota bacterium]